MSQASLGIGLGEETRDNHSLTQPNQIAQVDSTDSEVEKKARVRISKAERERRRMLIAERLLSGVSQTQIARDLGWNEAGVFRDVAVLESRWLEQANGLIEKKKARQEAKLDRMERKLNEWLAESEKEGSGQGNARYMELLAGIWDRRSKLYGLAQEGAGQASAVTVVAGIDLAAVLGQRPALVDMQPRPALEVDPEIVATNEDDLEDDAYEEAMPAKPKRPKREKQPTYSERLGLGSVFDGLSPKKRSPNHPDNNQPPAPTPQEPPIPNPHPEYPQDITTTEPDSQAWQDHANQAIHNLD